MKPSPQVIALGNALAGDDGAALRAAERIEQRLPQAEVLRAGRPGASLLDLWDLGRPVLLLDALQAGLAPGSIVEVPLSDLPEAAQARAPLSSHGLGPSEAIQLGRALGRTMPEGLFIGVQGVSYAPCETLSEPVHRALDDLTERAVQWYLRQA